MPQITGVDREHFEGLIRLLNLVFRPKGDFSMRDEVPVMFLEENWENLRIVRDGDNVVSHIGLLFRDALAHGCRIPLAMVGAVATHPDRRGAGLATELLHHCFAFARERGACLMQISGGRGLYTRNGARPVGCRLEGFVAARALASVETAGFRCERFLPAHIDACAVLYRNKPLRYVRPRGDWAIQIEKGKAKAHDARFLAVMRAGRPAGYVIYGAPNAEGKSHVVEYGGLTAAVLAGLRTVLAGGVSELRIDVPPFDVEMAEQLAARGVSLVPRPLDCTIRVVDFPALMEALRGGLVERLGAREAEMLRFVEEGGACRFVRGAESLDIADPAELAEVIFGVAGAAHERLAACPGELGERLRAALPMPLPGYDLNYI